MNRIGRIGSAGRGVLLVVLAWAFAVPPATARIPEIPRHGDDASARPEREDAHVWAAWETPSFAWDDDEADFYASWTPGDATREEAIPALDDGAAREVPSQRTAATRTWRYEDTGWTVVRASAAPAEPPVDRDGDAHALALPGVEGLLVPGTDLPEGLRLDAAPTGFGLVEAVRAEDGDLPDRTIRRSLRLPEGVEARAEGHTLTLLDADGDVVGRMTATALGPEGTARTPLRLRVVETDDHVALVATAAAQTTRRGLRAMSFAWRVGDAAPGFGLLTRRGERMEAEAACFGCSDPAGRAGLWLRMDWRGTPAGRGVHRAWLDLSPLPGAADGGVGFSWERPDAWTPEHARQAAIDARLDLPWRPPADDGPAAPDGLRVASGDALDMGVGRAVAAARAGTLLLWTDAARTLADDPLAEASLAAVALSVDVTDPLEYPLAEGVDLSGDCSGPACWSELGWRVHGRGAERFARTAEGAAVSVTSDARCNEPVDASLVSPWIVLPDDLEPDHRVRWFDATALRGDWGGVDAELRLEYRWRRADWSVGMWEAIADGATREDSDGGHVAAEGTRQVTSWAASELPDGVRAVQARYRLVGEACPVPDGGTSGDLGDDPLAGAKEAAAKAVITGYTYGNCNGTCIGSGNQCGGCHCHFGWCRWDNYVNIPSCPWTCGGTATNEGACRTATARCYSGVLSCTGQVCPTGETCNGVDDNCNGSTDEENAGGCTTYYADVDGDGYGGSSSACLCAKTGFYTTTASGDCNDANASIRPGAAEPCDGIDNDCQGGIDEGQNGAGCDTWYYDADNDSYGTGSNRCYCKATGNWRASVSGDCNDGSASISPGNPERCWTSADDNCNGTNNDRNAAGCSTRYWDSDNDGYGTSASRCYCSDAGTWRATQSGDCHDGNSSVNPGATEVCNGVNDNCVNGTDEGLGTTTCGTGECYHTQQNCVGGVTQTCDPYQGAVPESCDGLDNNCNGSTDESWSNLGSACDGTDSDLCAEGVYACKGDGSGVYCTDGTGHSVETCNGVDDDCDGTTDEQNAGGCTTYYYDGDNDGYGTGSSKCLCAPSGVYRATSTGDCVDSDAAIHPGHAEWCDNRDNDCQGDVDEGFGLGNACDSGDTDSCQDGVVQCASNTTTKCDGEVQYAFDFDNGTADASGEGHSFSLGNGASYTSGGYSGKGLQLDGYNDYAVIPGSSDLVPTDGITLALWVRPDGGIDCSGGNNWRYLAAKSGWGEYHLIFEQSYGIGWTVNVNGSSQRLWSSSNSLPANQWTHFVATYDLRTGQQRTYVNGVLNTQRTGAVGSIPDYGGDLRLGNWTAANSCQSGSGAFPGRIDDFTMARRALSPAEISTLYARDGRPSNLPDMGLNAELCDAVDNDCDGSTDEGHATGGSCDSAADGDACSDNRVSCAPTGWGTSCAEGAVGRWLVNENSDSTVTDRSGFGNHGTAYNVGFDAEGAYFNGSSSYVLIPGDATLDAPDYSVSVWVKPQVDNEYWTGVFGQYGGGRSMSFFMGASNSTGSGRVHHTGAVPGNSNYSCNADWTLPKDTWTHVVMTHDGDGRRQTWVNGNLACDKDGVGPNVATGPSRNIVVGRDPDGGTGRTYKGWIKDVTLFRHALTPPEVAEMYATDGSFTETLEVCDVADNDCDGQTDEGFSLYGSCDGSDADGCSDATMICDASGLGTTCRDASPVGFWDFDEATGTTAADVADNSNPHHGSFQSDPAWVDGRSGTGLHFDGNDAVNIGHYPELSVATPTMTMEAWVKESGGSMGGIILNKESSYEIAVNGGRFQCAIMTTSNGWFWTGAKHVADGAWHHVACILDHDGRIKTFVDGVHQSSSGVVIQGGAVVRTTTAPLRIGRRAGGSYMNHGVLDEVAVYDFALTPQELAAHASAGELVAAKNFERCDGRDNDCSGAVDDAYPTLDDACDAADGDACADGRFVCTADMLSTACGREGAATFFAADETAGSTVHDMADGTSHGTFYNGTRTATAKAGGGALRFDGSGDYLQFPTDGITNKEGAIAFWMQPDWDGSTSVQHGMFQTNSGVNSSNWLSIFQWSSGTFYFRLGASGTCCDNDVTTSSSGRWSAGQWVHVAAVWSQSEDRMSLFFDGVKVRERTGLNWSGPALHATARFGIGHDRWMDGRLDEMGLWDYPLSDAQVQELAGGTYPAVARNFEACDGANNDCAGGTDDPYALGVACDGGDLDLCNEGVTVCDAATLATTTCNDNTGSNAEVCNGSDDDCDGSVDEGENLTGCTPFYYDGDSDGYGTSAAKCLCAASGSYTAAVPGDCNDGNGSVHPGATESCNGTDDDCNGQVDETGSTGCTTWYADVDGDGYGAASDSACLCAPSGVYSTTDATDCNDGNGNVHPNAAEACNSVDDDCNGATDEGLNVTGCTTYYQDSDNDGWGSASSQCRCAPSGDFDVTQTGDCHDGDAAVNPDAAEACNSVDDDCNGSTDEGLGSTTCGVGACVHSQPNCVGGVPQTCDPLQGATAEACDGLDNNCDGATDEAFTDLGAACDGADPDGCVEGVKVCRADGTGTTCAQDGPVAFWSLDEGTGAEAFDASGYGHALGLSNEAWSAGRQGGGGLFKNGGGAGATAADSPALRLREWSAAVWMKPVANTGEWVRVIGKGDPANRNYGLWRHDNGMLLCQYRDGGGGYHNCSAGGVLPLGSWSHAACTYDGSTLRVWVNGSQVASCGGHTADPVTSGDPVEIGGSQYMHQRFVGELDEVGIWGHALTAGDVGTLASTGLPASSRNHEYCNGADDDCDGQTDELWADLGNACDGPDGDLCAEGSRICAASGVATTCGDTTGTNAELCDAVDNDCDGSTDEGFSLGEACDDGDADACTDGRRVCDGAGGVTCGSGAVVALTFDLRQGGMALNEADDAGTHDATLSHVTAVAGVSGDAFHTAGGTVDRFIRIPSAGLSDDSFTLAFWFKPDDTSSSNHYLSVSGGPGGSNALLLRADGALYAKGTSYGGAVPLTAGAWSHVVVRHDAVASTLTAHVDGTQTLHTSVAAGGFAWNGDIWLGQEQDCPDGCFAASQAARGAYDELAWFDRAVTDGEIASLAAGGLPATYRNREVCDGADNDCVAGVDDPYTDLGSSCDGGDADLCHEGSRVCASSRLATVCDDTTADDVDICNGVDDDCDGQTDEDFPSVGAPCDGPDSDLCEEGVYVCNGAGSGVTCSDTSADDVEVCDLADNDCDGSVDEGVPGVGVACDDGDADLCDTDSLTLCDPVNGGIVCGASASPVYTFEATSLGLDASGDAHDATVAGATQVVGQQGIGLDLPGVDTGSYVRVPQAATDHSHWAVSFWMNPDGATNSRFILSRTTAATNNGLIVGQGGCLYVGGPQVFPGLVIPAGTWTHVAVVGRGDHVSYYVDGALTWSGTSSSPLDWASDLWFGQEQDSDNGGFAASQAYDGQLDEIAYYARALSAAEVTALAAGPGVPAVARNLELCDGADNDCDGTADDAFPTLGDACDGDDADQCTDGTYICDAEGTGVTCRNDGPVALFDFGEQTGATAHDVSGGGHHATLQGGAGWSATDREAVTLDGASGWVEAPHAPALAVPGEATVETWLWLDAWPSATQGYAGIVSKGNSPRNYSLYLLSDGRMHFSTAGQSGSHCGSVSTGTVPTGQWAHVAVTTSGDWHQEHRYYVDGALVGTSVFSDGDCVLPMPTGSEPLQIGRTPEPNRWLDGRVDRLAVYDRALSEAEITGLAADGGATAPLVANEDVCDGADNDCDGVIDEDFATLGDACDGADSDLCAHGTSTCDASAWDVECANETLTDIAETCNGADDDCDGSTDEDFPYTDPETGLVRNVGQSCFGVGACDLGTVECASSLTATCSTNPGQSQDMSAPEACNGVDDDCDSATDEQADGAALTLACYTGPAGTEDVGACRGGTRTCAGGAYGSCDGQITPTTADLVCDGLDEDCDAGTDEDYAPIPCGVGACASVSTCVGGVESACSPGDPSPDDQCNGIDDDCDDQTDEHYAPIPCGTGVCASTSACLAGGVEEACAPGDPTMADETMNCDGLDNDCDGDTDEQYDDGVACTLSTCTGGVASDVPDHASCDDGQPCTDDQCHATLDCVSIADDTNAPDPALEDTNPCTDLVCSGGASVNAPDDSNVPDDGLACTLDTCAAGDQRHDVAPGTCLIGGVCYAQGDVDPADSCGVCFPEEDDTGWSEVVFREHFDGAVAGWTFEDLSGSGVGWQVDDGRAHTAPNSLYLGDPVTRTYGDAGRVHARATTDPVFLPDGVVTLLDFRLWLQTEGFNQAIEYDVLWIEVVDSVGQPTAVWNSVEGAGGSTSGDFRHTVVDLGDFAGQEVRLRFRFDTADGYYNDHEGAYVDAIELRTACCAAAADCDDGDDLCTIDTCEGGRCDHIHTCDACTPTPANMLVALDFSASMSDPAGAADAQTRWEAATATLADAFDTFGPVMNSAAKLFRTPGATSCGVNPSSLEIGWHASGADFQAVLSGLTPGGQTPMAAGLQGAGLVYAGSELQGARHVLLVTDGAESCGGDPVAAVEDLAAAGVEAWVLGYDPTGSGIDHDALNQMAEAGGHAQQIESASEPAYYLATSASELDQRVTEVLGGASGEQCNGVDDDCDGLTDEGVAPIACNISCGIFAMAGERHCEGGTWGACTVAPETELCNGLDDNCNGVVDDPWTDATGPALGESCTVGVGACAADGVYVCPADGVSEPVCDAVPGNPTAEVCDGIDNDCNGLTDDGLTRDCSTACGAGFESCIAGQWVDCTAPPELPDTQCDDVDNDCDGVTDPLFPERGGACDGADSDQCLYGTWTCSADALSTECVNEEPSDVQEVCDGNSDEDCDGSLDEEGAVGCIPHWYDGDQDGYGAGTSRCLCWPEGLWTATQGGDCDDTDADAWPANPEVCDNVDNDCDGVVDDSPSDSSQPLTRDCYEGPEGTEGVGVCTAGTETCTAGAWGQCVDQVLPSVTETCNGADDNCNGLNDGEEPSMSGGDLACEQVSYCEFGDCICYQSSSTGQWSCILE